MKVLKIYLRIVWFTLLVQCDPVFSKLIQLRDNSSSLPISSEFDRDNWDEEELAFNRGYGKGSTGPTVVTDCGTYQGLYGGNKKGCEYEKFLGIAYAQPPVGPLRFRRPVPRDCMEDMEYQATEFGPPCMQPRKKALKSSGMEPSEDCLYLNIYRPSNTGPNDAKPVLVYIYESYFLYGSAAQPELNGGILAAIGGIIVVTCNYRLGAFGFLNGGFDGDGNMGGFDVVECVNWVKDHIQYFGGNPFLVTIGGNGAGATMAAGFLLNPRIPRDFIQGVMIMSADFNQQSFFDSALIALEKSNAFIKLINCGEGDKTETFSPHEAVCAQSADADTLAEASDKIPFYDGNGICSMSQLMGNYELSSIDDRLQKGMFRKNKYIYLGNVITEFGKSLIGSKAKTKEEGTKVISEYIPPIILDQSIENIEKIIKYYLGFIGKNDSFAVGKRTTLALNNVCYGCLTAELINYFSPYNKVYAYQYSYVASWNQDDPKRIYGPYHLDDVHFGFGEPFRALKKYSDYDREVSRTLIGIWSDFVSQKKMQWPSFDYKNRFIGLIQGDMKSNTFITSPYTDICRRLNS